MKKTLVLSVVLLLAATVAFAQGTTEKTYVDQIRDRGVLQVGCKVDVPNFGYKNITTGEIEGFEIDLSKAVAKKIFGDENKVAFTWRNGEDPWSAVGYRRVGHGRGHLHRHR
jgi:putative glutamine transport system substrate-binding protein